MDFFRLLAPITYIYIGSVDPHYTNIGIKENGYFGVNIPSVDQMGKNRLCGPYFGT